MQSDFQRVIMPSFAPPALTTLLSLLRLDTESICGFAAAHVHASKTICLCVEGGSALALAYIDRLSFFGL